MIRRLRRTTRHPILTAYYLAERRHEQVVRDLRQTATTGLHLGCGAKYIDGLINADLYDDTVRDIAVDSLRLSNFDDASVDLIEHHHMLEHLSVADARKGLEEWARVLRPGGWLVMTTPNMDAIARLWIVSSYRGKFGPVDNSSLVDMLYGSQENDGMFHRAAYNPRHLRKMLTAGGFKVRRLARRYPAFKTTPSMLVIAQRSPA